MEGGAGLGSPGRTSTPEFASKIRFGRFVDASGNIATSTGIPVRWPAVGSGSRDSRRRGWGKNTLETRVGNRPRCWRCVWRDADGEGTLLIELVTALLDGRGGRGATSPRGRQSSALNGGGSLPADR